MRLYRATVTDITIQITVRIWSTADHGWLWAPLDTWTPDPTPATPAELSDELHRHGWVTATPPTTLTGVPVTPDNWQDLVTHACNSRNQLAAQVRVAENVLTDILGDAADAGLTVTSLADSIGLSRIAIYKRAAKTIDSMRHAAADGETLTPSHLTHAERAALGLADE